MLNLNIFKNKLFYFVYTLGHVNELISEVISLCRVRGLTVSLAVGPSARVNTTLVLLCYKCRSYFLT